MDTDISDVSQDNLLTPCPVFDFNNVCRLCLSTTDENMMHIFVEQPGVVPLPLRIMACTPLEIKHTDGLPQQVCKFCHAMVDAWYKFKDLCESSDRILQGLSDGNCINYEEICKIRSAGAKMKSEFRTSTEKAKDVTKREDNFKLSKEEKRSVQFVECSKCLKHFSKKSLPLHMAQMHGRKRKRGIKKPKKAMPMPKLRTLIKIINGDMKNRPLVSPKTETPLDTCNICGAEFITEHELLEHVASEHGIVKDEPIVPQREPTRKTAPHVQEVSLFLDVFADCDVEQRCKECGDLFPNESELLLHRFTVHRTQKVKKVKPMPCPDCDQQFSATKLLYQHIREMHRFRCPDCNDGFHTQHDLDRHKIEMGDHKQTFNCLDCGLTFEDKMKLNEHMKQKVQCDICNKIVSRPQRLIEHKLIKHNIGVKKEFQCEICGKGFPYATSLRYHKRIHGEKNIVCQLCGKTFHFLCNYNVHMDLHHSADEDKVICEHCGDLYPKCKMRDHLARHSNPSLPCDLCGKLFRLKNQLKRHKIQLHKETAYSCPLCSKGFVKTQNLETHLLKIHNQHYRIIPNE